MYLYASPCNTTPEVIVHRLRNDDVIALKALRVIPIIMLVIRLEVFGYSMRVSEINKSMDG